MSVEIKKVCGYKDLKNYIEYPNRLYRGNRYFVPKIFYDELAIYDKKNNAAFDFCESDSFLAYRDGEIVGRVTALVNHKANKTWDKNEVRFGWIDFIDDYEVSKALIDTVITWGKERGLTEIAGPLGFTDMDMEGMLVDGFDQLGTMITMYNHPYYMVHMERLGMTKVVDWVENLIKMPETLPEKMSNVSAYLLEKNNLHVVPLTRKLIKKGNYGQKFFDLINCTYCDLYGFSKLSQRQIDQYVKTYLALLDLEMVCFIENERNELIAAGVTIPSLSLALQKCRGKLFPFGWFHLLKAMKFKKMDRFDMLLIGVMPEYQNKGVNSLIFAHLLPVIHRIGFKYAESNPNLENNVKVLAQWEGFESSVHKRRRIYGKSI